MSTGEQGVLSTKKAKFTFEWKKYTSVIGLLVLVAISGILSSDFFTTTNVVNILKQIVVPICTATGMTYLIMTGGIDLSAGSVIALMGTLTGMLLKAGVNWILTVIIVLAAGIVVGCFYGTLVGKFNIPPFIATLAGYTAYKGLALLITNSAAILVSEPTFLAISSKNIGVIPTTILFAAAAAYVIVTMITKHRSSASKGMFIAGNVLKLVGLAVAYYLFFSYGGTPIMILIAVAVFLIFNFVLSRTVFGAEVYAIGGNKNAAKLAGIAVTKRIIQVYAIGGFCATLAGILTASRLGSGAPQTGMLAEQDAIAAVIIGGTSMSGGVGKLSGTIVGVALIGVLNNMLSLLGASSYMQQIMKGVIILVAVFIDLGLSKRGSNK